MIVTIDGPAGTGKSTIARQLADQLGFQFLDTGAMYRAVAWQCLQNQLDLSNPELVAETAHQTDLRINGCNVYINQIDRTNEIRSPEVAKAASLVAAVPAVRARLVLLQQQHGQNGNLVTEGRDQGTVVFPHAEFKFYLTATPEERARRRLVELQKAGTDRTLAQILQEQNERDDRDLRRECGPLKRAADAIEIDTSLLDLQGVLNVMLATIRRS